MEEWTDRDGKQRYTLEVHATDMQFIGGRGEEGTAGMPASRASSADRSSSSAPEPDLSDDDIPF